MLRERVKGALGEAHETVPGRDRGGGPSAKPMKCWRRTFWTPDRAHFAGVSQTEGV